jgi:hypothetical protein
MTRISAFLVAGVLAIASWGANAAAVYTTKFQQVGGDVVATGSGAFDLTGMASIGSGSEENRIISSLGFFLFGSGGWVWHGVRIRQKGKLPFATSQG